MSHPEVEISYTHCFVVEGVASFFINLVLQNVHLLESGVFAIAGTYFAAVYISIQVSGAHLNGAVTMMTYLLDHYKNKKARMYKYYMYFISQIIGGTLAGLATLWLSGKDSLFELHYAKDTNSSAAFLLELIYAMLLCLVMGVVSDNNYGLNDPAQAGFLFAGVIFLTKATISDRTGGIINPSIALSVVFSRTIATGDVSELHKCMKYVLSSCSGAYGAFLLYKYYMYPVYEDLRKRAKMTYDSDYDPFLRRNTMRKDLIEPIRNRISLTSSLIEHRVDVGGYQAPTIKETKEV